MVIQKGKLCEIEAVLKITKALPEWFTHEAVENIAIDLKHNSFIIAKEDDVIVGFLCYTTYCGKALLLWMGVLPTKQNTGVGSALLEALEVYAKNLQLHSIEVETLPDEDDYEPYKKTRDFYYKHSFRRILHKKATTPDWDDQIVLEKKLG